MKTILFVSSIFFLLGLKIGSLIELPSKTNAFEKIITNVRSKSIKALPLFNYSDEAKTENKDKEQEESPSPAADDKTGLQD